MSTSLRFDHIIIAVRDVDAAIADYQALGFAVYYGGKHTHKNTHNGLISLADGSYLELLAPVDPDEIDGTIALLAEGEGYGGYALLSEALAADAARLTAAGMSFVGPSDGHRTRYDGERIVWQAINLEGTRSPFLIADVTAHDLRVPTDAEKVNHENGATGTAEVVVAVHDLAAATARYATILGVTPTLEAQDAAQQSVTFGLNGHVITLAQPIAHGTPLAEHLARFGEVPYLLRLRTVQREFIGLLDVEKAHGARLELVGV